MHVTTILQPLILFSFIAALVLGSQYLRARQRARIHETIDLAIRQGQPVPSELLEAVARRDGSGRPVSPLAFGLILLGSAVGLAIFGQVMGTFDTEAGTVVTGVAAIPFCIGVACLVLEFLGRKRP